MSSPSAAGLADKPPAQLRKCHPYTAAEGSTMGNQYHLLSKSIEFQTHVAQGRLFPHVAQMLCDKMRKQIVEEDRNMLSIDPS